MARTNVVRIAGFNQPADDLSAAIDSFLACCKSRNLSGCTISYYRYRLQAFKAFLAENAPTSAPEELTPNVIRDFLTFEAERNSAATANHSHVTLSAFFAFLGSEGFVQPNPMQNVEKPRRRKAVINTFTLEQVDAVLSTCGKDFAGARDRALIVMLIDCGLRASEIAGLELDDVNWAEGTVLVLGKGDKERVVPFGQATRQALTAYMSRRGDLDTKGLFVSTLGA
jgi:site-specific recombinase XerD